MSDHTEDIYDNLGEIDEERLISDRDYRIKIKTKCNPTVNGVFTNLPV